MSIATYCDVLLPASLAACTGLTLRFIFLIYYPQAQLHLLEVNIVNKQTAMDDEYYSLNQVIDTSHHECSRVKDKPSVRDFFSLSHTYVIMRIRYLCKYKAHIYTQMR